MLKISDAVRNIIEDSSFLGFAFKERLLNLSQVARYIKDQVAAQTQKEVQESAILMSLSRLQNKLEGQGKEPPKFFVDKLSIHSNLCSLTLNRTVSTYQSLSKLFNKLYERGAFLTITEGMTEITTILENDHLEEALEMFPEPPRFICKDLAAVTAKFSPKYLNTPGLLFRILHQVTMQNINLIEIASTATEFNIFLQQKDVALAFDSLYRAFVRRKQI